MRKERDIFMQTNLNSNLWFPTCITFGNYVTSLILSFSDFITVFPQK